MRPGGQIKNALKEIGLLIRENRIFFLAPLVIAVVLFAFLFFKIGSGVIMTFIYAGL